MSAQSDESGGSSAAPDRAPATGGKSDHRWAGLFVLATALSMIVLDGTIVGVALPTIIDDLHLDLNDAQWVNASYSVVFAALLLTAGRLGDRLGDATCSSWASWSSSAAASWPPRPTTPGP